MIVVGGAILIHRLGVQLNMIGQSSDAQGIVCGLVEQVRVGFEWIDNKAEREVRSHADKTSVWSPEEGERSSREFEPVVKVDQLVREMIQNDETKEPFARFQGQGCA